MPVSLPKWQRRSTVDLWRRGLVRIFYEQTLDANPSLQGPFYALTMVGARLAQEFLFPAPRGLSGA